MMPAGFSTSPCRSMWTMVVSDIARPAYPVLVRPGSGSATPSGLGVERRGGGCRGRRQRVGDASQGALVVRRGQEPRLERRGGQVYAAVEHGVEERRVGRNRLVLRVGE